MKGIFIKRSRSLSILLATFFILVGTLIAVRFGTWAIDAIKEGLVALAIFSFGFALIGIDFGCMSIFIFNFNRKAFFEIENSKINIICGFGSQYDLSIDDLADVSLQGKNLLLTTQTERIAVSNLENAKEICEYLQRYVAKNTQNIDFEREKQNYINSRKSLIIRLIPTITTACLMFVPIGWCVLLTEGSDLGDFTSHQNMIFVAFAVAEIITLALAFWLARICGKAFVLFEESRKRMAIANARLHRKDALEKYAGFISAKYFDFGRYRIVVFSPNGEVFGYMLESFDDKESKWKMCYEKAKGFAVLSDLYDDLEEAFSDVILED